MSSIYEERNNEFADNYEALEVDGVTDLIIAWGELGERLFMDTDAVSEAMFQLFRKTTGETCIEDYKSWSDLWTFEVVACANLRITEIFTTINAYAFFGLGVDGSFFNLDDASELSKISKVVEMARGLIDSLPESWLGPRGMTDTLLAAEGRLALDRDQPVSVEQLAALGRVGVRSIKNLLMPSSSHPLRVDSDGLIPAGDALGWLGKREDYRNSIWSLRDLEEGALPTEASTIEDEILFIPVAKDGTWFDPQTCLRSQGYYIGPKGDERMIESYREALAALVTMAPPRWRRPNENGHWGIVRGDGDRWLRRTARELGLNSSN